MVDKKQLVQKAAQEISQIATLPEVTVKIVQMVEDPRSAARDLHKVIKHDVALSARILKVVNSAFYGLPRQVSSVDRAIVLLGLSTVKNIAIAASVSKMFRGRGLSSNYTAKDLWMHSLACGVFSRMIGEKIDQAGHDELFVAGLMHDLGILVERQVYPDKLAEAIDMAAEGKCTLCEAETRIIGADHQEFGAALADKWKFPLLFQISTGYHHRPLVINEDHRRLAAAVYLADTLTRGEVSAETGLVSDPDDDCYSQCLELLEMTPTHVQDILENFPEKFDAAQGMMA